MNNELNVYMKNKKSIIDKELSLLFKNRNKYTKDLYNAMAYSTMAGGKRIRPILLIMIYEMLSDKSIRDIIPIALSIEMVHTYSLIHDDLPGMDDDSMRRGKPTLHKRYNEATAILAGDALFSYAIEVFLNANIKEKILLNALKYFLNSIGPQGMVCGQYVDTQIDNFERNANTLKFIHKHKTANMIKACFVLPAIILNKKKDIELLENIGMNAGILFQIIDDILDIVSDKDTLGKTTRKDIEQNKLTYITLFGVERAKNEAYKQYKKIMKAIRELNYNTVLLEQMINYFYKRIK